MKTIFVPKTMNHLVWCERCNCLTGYYGMDHHSKQWICFGCDLVLSDETAKIVTQKEEAAFLEEAADRLVDKLSASY